jgi:hypothetical protein
MTADHPTRSPDSPDHQHGERGTRNDVYCAVHGWVGNIHWVSRNHDQHAPLFAPQPPRSPDSVRTPDLDALGLTRHYNPATGQLWHHDDCPDEDHRYDLHALLAAAGALPSVPCSTCGAKVPLTTCHDCHWKIVNALHPAAPTEASDAGT